MLYINNINKTKIYCKLKLNKETAIDRAQIPKNTKIKIKVIKTGELICIYEKYEYLPPFLKIISRLSWPKFKKN